MEDITHCKKIGNTIHYLSVSLISKNWSIILQPSAGAIIMKLNFIFHAVLCSLLSFPVTLAGPSCCRADITSSAYHDRLLENYIAVWGGDLSLIGTIFHPDVVLYLDRFPSKSGKGSTVTHVTNRTELVAFVERSRGGWKEYRFEPIRSVAADHSIAVRWEMHGILGSNFTLFQT